MALIIKEHVQYLTIVFKSSLTSIDNHGGGVLFPNHPYTKKCCNWSLPRKTWIIVYGNKKDGQILKEIPLTNTHYPV